MRFIFIILVFLTKIGFSQTISGKSPVTGGSTETYTYKSTTVLSSPSWQRSNCTLVSTTSDASKKEYSITVTWSSSASSGSVTLFSVSTPIATKVVTIVSPPPAPNVLEATVVSSYSFVANWASVSGASSYLIDVSNDFNFNTFLPGYDGLLGSAAYISQSVSALNPNSTYYYRVRAIVNGITSSNSNVISVTTMAVPTATSATLETSNSFTANWGGVSGASGYLLDVSTDNFQTFVSGYQNLPVGIGTLYYVGSLSQNTTYRYRIRATNSGGGISGYSNAISVKTSLTSVQATGASNVTGTSFVANWLFLSTATGWEVDVSTDSGFPINATTTLKVSGSPPASSVSVSAPTCQTRFIITASGRLLV